MKIIVLGAGLVGAPMAKDLAKDARFEITVADINPENLEKLSSEKNIITTHTDISYPAGLIQLLKNHDLALNAVPGHMGFQTLKTIIECKKNVIDIAFFPEDLFELDSLAKKNNVVAISDIGVAPGMSNILVAYAKEQLDETHSAKIYVGGLPKTRTWPWEYKAVFSPIDVIEEYTRPARFVENKKLITKPALTDPELLDFPYVGALEAFNSDGLRSLIKTLDIPDMIEKTLRYPGHIDKIKVLKETGFFNEDEIEINGKKIKPVDFTTALLLPKWKLEKGEQDITVMKIIVEGIRNGKRIRYEYDLYDEYDSETDTHSMARTTGYTATSTVRLVADGLYKHKGISPPEFIGKDKKCVDFILRELKERNIVYTEKISKI